MPYEVEVNQYLGLAVCTLWGLVWVEERQAALDEVLAEMEDGRPYRILVDMIGASCANDSLATSAAFAQRLATERKLKGCRFAYLYPDGARINLAVERLAEARDFKFRRFTRRPKRSTGCSRRRRASSPRRRSKRRPSPMR